MLYSNYSTVPWCARASVASVAGFSMTHTWIDGLVAAEAGPGAEARGSLLFVLHIRTNIPPANIPP